MTLINLKEMQKLSSAEINKKIIETKRKIFDLKFQQATGQTVKPHLFKAYKRLVAQLLTVKNQINLV